MQIFASKHQRKLGEYIEDAEEWASAKVNAAFWSTSDWDLLCQAYAAPCPHGDTCAYKHAAAEIFAKNSRTLDRSRLANALRAIIQNGPAKHTRIVLLAGPSNSGKSTLMYPFDDIFGAKYVLHKPALGSTFALRNITRKRFIFWDDYNPVEFAHEKTVTKSIFLSLFIGKHAEVQCSQSFSDGNKDVIWNRGVVFTAKSEGLWTPTSRVSEEDIKHLRNRCDEYLFEHVFERTALKEVPCCTHCMAAWIIEGARDYDAACLVANGALLPSLSAEPQQTPQEEPIQGFKSLMDTARIPEPERSTLADELAELGAVDVTELLQSDWEGLAAWSGLRPLQQRRLLQHVIGPQRG